MSAVVIFLDMDGVLCTPRSCIRQTGLMQTLDPCGVWMLEALIKEFDCQLVLSSTWRLHHDKMAMTAILVNGGLGTVPWHHCWKTPEFEGRTRGTEIADWLNTVGPETGYLILDDDTDFTYEQSERHLVTTHAETGFTWNNYEHAKDILKRERERVPRVPKDGEK